MQIILPGRPQHSHEKLVNCKVCGCVYIVIEEDCLGKILAIGKYRFEAFCPTNGCHGTQVAFTDNFRNAVFLHHNDIVLPWQEIA
jgi:hypothetical protein